MPGKTGKGLLLILMLLAAWSFPLVAEATLYDLTADWSDTDNPNGVWSYNKGGAPLPSVNNYFGTPGQRAWAVATSGSGHIPVWFMPISGTNAGDVLAHSWDPANGGAYGEANVTWTSDTAGEAHISGGIWYTGTVGRSTDWRLYLNGVLLSSGSVLDGGPYDKNNPFDFAAGSGGTAALDFVAAVGDVVMLELVRTQGDYYGNMVGVDLKINVVPVPPSAWLLGSGLLGLAVLRRRRS